MPRLFGRSDSKQIDAAAERVCGYLPIFADPCFYLLRSVLSACSHLASATYCERTETPRRGFSNRKRRLTMTAKKLIAAGALIVGATLATATASFAQYYGGPYGYGGGPGLYDYAPGYGGYGGYYNYSGSPPYWLRGGPGPRVGGGSGTGIGAQR
jgi:hypothetical protein